LERQRCSILFLAINWYFEKIGQERQISCTFRRDIFQIKEAAMTRKKTFFGFLALLVPLFLILSGCAGPIHPMEKSGMVQLQTAAPIAVRPGGKYVMVQGRDGTGNNMNIQACLIDKLRNRGKAVVLDVKNADYILSIQPVSLCYQRDTSRVGGGATFGALALGALAGGLVGGLTGDPWLGLAAAAGGAATGAAIGYHLDQQVAPGIIVAKVHIRVDERVSFLGERQTALPEPIQKYRKVKKTLKSGKVVWVKEKIVEEEEAETPVKSTVAAAQSGTGATTLVTDRRVAEFVPHQTDVEVRLVVESEASREEILRRLEEKIAEVGANVI
jgi:hypothetical protein